MELFFQDLKYCLRTLRQQRAFTIAAVATLALGIGATTAVFSVVNAVLLRPFPFPDADRIVLFMNTSPNGGSFPSASPAKFAHWRRQTDAVQEASAYRTVLVNYTGGDTPEQVTTAQVSPPFFRLLGATPVLGRTFTADEDLPTAGKVAVLSYGWWTRHFAADPAIVGKTISLSGEPYVVIGVIGKGFDQSDLGDTPDLWTMFPIDPNTRDQAHYFRVFGRIAPGVTLAQAQAKLAQSAAAYRERFPGSIGPKAAFSVEPMQKVFVRNSQSVLIVLIAAVAGVLLIACANVASLLLVRSTVRKRELAIRAAMGADRGRIIRQLLTESVLLSSAGGAAGLTLGLVGIRSLMSVNTANLPRLGDGGAAIQLDWRLAVFTVVVSIVTGLLFGVAPALQAARQDLSGTLRDGTASAGHASHHVRSTLVVAEIALALALVIGSGLLIRTSLALRAVAPGFDASNVLTMTMSFTGPRFQTSMSVEQAIRDGADRLRTVSGVELASASCCVPLQGGYGLPFRVVGKELPEGQQFHGGGDWITVSPGYFEVFKIPVLRGRTFTDRDDANAPPVVIINEAMAKETWKKGDPLNDRLAIGRGGMKEFAAEPDRQIIGVVADSRDAGLNQDPGPKMFVPQAQIPDNVNVLNTKIAPMSWVIRTRVPPLSISGAVASRLREATGLPVADIRSMDQIVSRSTSREQFNTLLMTVFALSALALAAIGIYGVMAYAVQQRTREIGVRLALGAEPSGVRMMVVLQGMRLALVGVVIGLATAYGLSRYMKSLLFGVEVRDPLVFVGVPLVLAVVALAAVWIPAARASRIDPLGALRSA